MKVAVVTVFNSPNYGSCWQARALCTYIARAGHEVVLYDTGARSTWKRIVRPALLSTLNALMHGNWKKSSFQLRRVNAFRKMLSAFPIIRTHEELFACDAIVFGSDEIWNVRRKEMRDYPIFWGAGIIHPRKISYAVSVNTAQEQELRTFGAQALLKELSAISVRDQWSLEQLQPLADKPIVKVLDPTLMHTPHDYAQYAEKPLEPGYIAIYYFSPEKEQIERIREVARQLGRRLVSIGSWQEWCDESVVSENPFAYYAAADMVITNTFHGTAFAINYAKPFIAFGQGKRKICELLQEFGLNERLAEEMTVDGMVHMLCTPVDSNKMQKQLEQRREASRRFLLETIEACGSMVSIKGAN